MRISILIALLIHISTFVLCQKTERVYLPGTRINIIKPQNVLIPKHTSTLFIDSTIEFATNEFSNKDSLLNYMRLDILNSRRVIKENFEIQIGKHKGNVIISNYGYAHQFFQCYFGDSTFAVLTQCIYKNSVIGIKDRLLEIMKSMEIEVSHRVDFESYLSFSYDTNNVIKLVPNKHAVATSFTPNGVYSDSIFTITNISSLQFPPAPSVKSSMDLMMAGLVGQLNSINVQEVLFDGEININGQNAYKFNAICNRNGQIFELFALAIYDPKSSVYISCNIINNQYKQEAYNFLSSIKLKKDGF